jgi:hypothetical protein
MVGPGYPSSQARESAPRVSRPRYERSDDDLREWAIAPTVANRDILRAKKWAFVQPVCWDVRHHGLPTFTRTVTQNG